MKVIAKRLAQLNLTLRSGGAPGADSAFEEGCSEGGGDARIYLPWKGFNKNPSPLYDVCDNALEMGAYYYGKHRRMSRGVSRLMGRNCYQVLGQDLNSPVKFICCWTPGGGIKGGTGQALRIAADRDIPVFNLYSSSALDQMSRYLRLIGVKGLRDETKLT